MPSSHLILCHPLLLLPPIPPSIRVFSNDSTLSWGGQSTGVLALASFLPKKSQGWYPSEWTGWISLQSKGLSRVFSNTTVQRHQFFSAKLSSQSNSHIHTYQGVKAKLVSSKCWSLKWINACKLFSSVPDTLNELKPSTSLWHSLQCPFYLFNLENVHLALSLSSVATVVMRPLLHLLENFAILCTWVLPLFSHYWNCVQTSIFPIRLWTSLRGAISSESLSYSEGLMRSLAF